MVQGAQNSIKKVIVLSRRNAVSGEPSSLQRGSSVVSSGSRNEALIMMMCSQSTPSELHFFTLSAVLAQTPPYLELNAWSRSPIYTHRCLRIMELYVELLRMADMCRNSEHGIAVLLHIPTLICNNSQGAQNDSHRAWIYQG